jgi:thiosulfate dehydrogenase [quinone] large subunit
MAQEVVKTRHGVVIHNPPLARFLFDDTRLAPVWLIVRVLVGWSWMSAGLTKLGEPEWMVTGEALKGFWTRAVAVPDPPAKPIITYDWYRTFLQGMLDSGSYVWFAKLVAIGETVIGLCLILGLFVGIAAFVGAFMNWNYIMAGSASSNGFMALGAILLILAWKTAGWYGLDRFVLPLVGTPWQQREEQVAAAAQERNERQRNSL